MLPSAENIPLAAGSAPWSLSTAVTPAPKASSAIHAKNSAAMRRSSSTSTASPSTTSGWTTDGPYISRFICRYTIFPSTPTRKTLKPPPVEPTHPPTTISTRKTCLDIAGKCSAAMSFVAKPVVVTRATTWKRLSRKVWWTWPGAAAPAGQPNFTKRSSITSAVAPRTIAHQRRISMPSHSARTSPRSQR